MLRAKCKWLHFSWATLYTIRVLKRITKFFGAAGGNPLWPLSIYYGHFTCRKYFAIIYNKRQRKTWDKTGQRENHVPRVCSAYPEEMHCRYKQKQCTVFFTFAFWFWFFFFYRRPAWWALSAACHIQCNVDCFHIACDYPRRARSAIGVDIVFTLDVCLYVSALERKRLIGMTWNSEP